MGAYEVGIEISLPAKDKTWLERQKTDVLSKVDTLRKDVKGAETAVFALAASVFIGAGVVYLAHKRGR